VILHDVGLSNKITFGQVTDAELAEWENEGMFQRTHLKNPWLERNSERQRQTRICTMLAKECIQEADLDDEVWAEEAFRTSVAIGMEKLAVHDHQAHGEMTVYLKAHMMERLDRGKCLGYIQAALDDALYHKLKEAPVWVREMLWRTADDGK